MLLDAFSQFGCKKVKETIRVSSSPWCGIAPFENGENLLGKQWFRTYCEHTNLCKPCENYDSEELGTQRKNPIIKTLEIHHFGSRGAKSVPKLLKPY